MANQQDQRAIVISKTPPGMGSMLLAFLTGAGVTAGAFFIAQKLEHRVPTVERLLGRCGEAVSQLERQAVETSIA